MEFVKHPNHNAFMGAPRNWNEARDGPCGALSIHDMRDQQMPKMESCWAPSQHEAMCLALGIADIRLGILSNVHPPVYMSVLPKAFGDQPLLEKQVRDGLEATLEALREIARSNGFTVEMSETSITVEKL